MVFDRQKTKPFFFFFRVLNKNRLFLVKNEKRFCFFLFFSVFFSVYYGSVRPIYKKKEKKQFWKKSGFSGRNRKNSYYTKGGTKMILYQKWLFFCIICWKKSFCPKKWFYFLYKGGLIPLKTVFTKKEKKDKHSFFGENVQKCHLIPTQNMLKKVKFVFFLCFCWYKVKFGRLNNVQLCLFGLV